MTNIMNCFLPSRSSPTIPSNSTSNDLPWTEKYRPRTLNDLVVAPALMAVVRSFLKSGQMTHLLMSGTPGTGKTTILTMLAYSLSKNVLELNAGSERGIDVIRGQIKSFAKQPGDLKFVILDEAESLTSAAQNALRRLMEVHSEHTKFFFSCNNSNNLLDAIQSRCMHIKVIAPSADLVCGRLKQIVDKETPIRVVNDSIDSVNDAKRLKFDEPNIRIPGLRGFQTEVDGENHAIYARQMFKSALPDIPPADLWGNPYTVAANGIHYTDETLLNIVKTANGDIRKCITLTDQMFHRNGHLVLTPDTPIPSDDADMGTLFSTIYHSTNFADVKEVVDDGFRAGVTPKEMLAALNRSVQSGWMDFGGLGGEEAMASKQNDKENRGKQHKILEKGTRRKISPLLRMELLRMIVSADSECHSNWSEALFDSLCFNLHQLVRGY